MKKHLFLKSLLMAIGLLVTSFTTQVWATMANFIEGSYIYIDVSACSDWASSCTLKMNWFDSQGNSKGNYIGAESYTTNIYRFQIPSDGIGGFQIVRLNPSNPGEQYNYSNKMYAKNRSYDSQNCLCAPSGAVKDNANFTWSVYHPYTYVWDGDDSKVSQVMDSHAEHQTNSFVYSWKDWDNVDEKEFGNWNGGALTKTNGVYAYYVTEGRNYIVNCYNGGNSNQSATLYATKNPSQSHHHNEGTYYWNGGANSGDFYGTGIKIEIVSNAYELYVGESTTFTINAVSPLTGLTGLEIWEEGVKVTGTPSGSGTSRTFSFTATTPGIRNISARIHFTFNGHNIYLCAADMKIRVYEKYKIKVQNTLDWDALKLYMFRNADNAIKNAAWPGVLVEDKIANDGTHDWYFVELDSKFDRFMLANSDASKQTYSGGMSYDKASYEGYCYKMEGNSNTNNWTTKIDCPEFYRIKSVCAGGTYYSNVLMNAGKFSMYATTAGTLTLQHLVGSTWTDMASTITRTGITRDTVYVADFNGSNTTNNFVFYSGDYHIHCNATTKNYLDHGESKGGVGTKFTHFSKSSIFKDTYDYYWVDWFDGGQTVVATVGNDYNDNLAIKLGSDAYAPSGTTVGDGGNVRYGYDPETNAFTRSMLSAGGSLVTISSLGADSVMVIDNKDKYTLDAYDEARPFDDATNWVYTLDAEVRGTSHATVKSSYNGITYTLSDKAQLLGGAKGTKYEVEISYDFKTNRLLGAWMPKSGVSITGFDLQSNLMVVRREDTKPTVLNITGAENEVTGISKIYTTFELWKSSWDDASAPYEYAKRRVVSGLYTDEYYWFSLPYKCYMGDVFGIENYGPNGNWVVMTYHGDYRARDGWWAETESWWYYMDRTDTLQANQGYVLRVTNLDEVFPVDTDPKLYLYFPSYEENLTIGQLTGTVTTHLDSLKCTKWRKWKEDPDKKEGEGNPNWDRRAIDSNWRIIGSPSFNSTKITDPVFITASADTDKDGEVSPEEYQAFVESYIAANPGATPYSLKYFYNWEIESGTPKYTIANAATTEFVALSAHLVQYAGDITWAPWETDPEDEDYSPLVGIKAPKRQQEDGTGEQTLRLVLQQGDREADIAYISRMAFGATMGYDLNKDLSKMINAKSANIYTISELYKMAGNCIPDTVTTLPVGVQLASAGEYTFAMPEGTYGTGVVLIDKATDTRTNLALADYTVTLPAGTCDERFVLELSPIAQVPTSIETISDEGLAINGARKVMVDGTLYIVKDGKVYDAQGRQVK